MSSRSPTMPSRSPPWTLIGTSIFLSFRPEAQESVHFICLPVQALSQPWEEHRRCLMSVQTHMVGQGTLREDNSNSSGNSFSCALSPIYPGWVLSSTPYSIRAPDESRVAGLHFPGEEIEARKKKMGLHIWKKTELLPPPQPLNCLPSWAGRRGVPRRLPGPREALATQTTVSQQQASR